MVRLAGLSLGLVALACTSREPPTDADSRDPVGPPVATPACPSAALPSDRAPDVRPEHERAAYWLAKLAPEAADEVLLGPAELALLRERVAALPGGWRDPLGDASSDPALITRELDERLGFLRERVSTGKYIEGEDGALARAADRIGAAEPLPAPNLQFVAHETPLWCVPMIEGLFTAPIDRDFDRNRCASLHTGELVRALRRTPDGAWTYVDAGHSVGWIAAAEPAPLEPPLTDAAARARLDGPRVYLTADYQGLRHGSCFARVDPAEPSSANDGVTILVPGSAGPVATSLPADAPISADPWPLTRRRLFEQAFAQLGQPYGWGGRAGHRDCSRYLLDLFALFDVRLARNSSVQAQLGVRSEDLSALDEAAKREAIRAAARDRGVVLLYMPGHIMLYLGHERGPDGVERDYGISALSEYLEPCPGGPDTVYRLDEVAVTTLDLGRGTERRAFIERITRMAVFEPLERSSAEAPPN